MTGTLGLVLVLALGACGYNRSTTSTGNRGTASVLVTATAGTTSHTTTVNVTVQ